ncbi:CCSMST1 family [Cinara cedri]|uniref:CCSMST1 family n=1 Tax=Cinara cedri TaxID=506608 RepID=A0A5E4MHM4_9HEMI|nr:CCSMST1 family [Cinara cedri]
MFKQLTRSFIPRINTGLNLLKQKENKLWISSIPIRNKSKTNRDLDEELYKPLNFTNSPASDWKAQYSRVGGKAEFGPWYEAHVVSASVIIFMIYFFILREENDIDELLTKPLTETLKKD